MTSIYKAQFPGLNDKPYYISNDIVSFPYGHPLLEKIRTYKKELKEKTHQIIREKRFDMLKIEVKAITSCERLRYY